MNMSIIDQRPIASTTRYSTVLSRSAQGEPRCVEISRISRPINFSTGTATLAKNTNAASGHMPSSSNSLVPPRIVLGSPAPSRTTVNTG